MNAQEKFMEDKEAFGPFFQNRRQYEQSMRNEMTKSVLVLFIVYNTSLIRTID